MQWRINQFNSSTIGARNICSKFQTVHKSGGIYSFVRVIKCAIETFYTKDQIFVKDKITYIRV